MHLRLVDMQVRNVKVKVWEESHNEKEIREKNMKDDFMREKGKEL